MESTRKGLAERVRGTLVLATNGVNRFGSFWDQVLVSDWFVQLRKDVADAHPQLRMADQVVMYNAIAD